MFGSLTKEERIELNKCIKIKNLEREIVDCNDQLLQLVKRLFEFQRTNTCHLIKNEVIDLNKLSVRIRDACEELKNV